MKITYKPNLKNLKFDFYSNKEIDNRLKEKTLAKINYLIFERLPKVIDEILGEINDEKRSD